MLEIITGRTTAVIHCLSLSREDGLALTINLKCIDSNGYFFNSQWISDSCFDEAVSIVDYLLPEMFEDIN